MNTIDLVRGFFDNAAAGHPYNIDEITTNLEAVRTPQAVRLATKALAEEGYLERFDPTEDRKLSFARAQDDDLTYDNSEDAFELFGRYTFYPVEFLKWLAERDDFGSLLAEYSAEEVPVNISEGTLASLTVTEGVFDFRVNR